MKDSDKKQLLKQNTILWLVAMVMPAIFHFALGSAKFPWPVVLPMLFIGLMLASNKMLSSAMEESEEVSKPG